MTSTGGSSKSKTTTKVSLSYENDDTSFTSKYVTQFGYRTCLNLWVNGEKVSPQQTQQARPEQTLLDFLRTTLQLTGSKLGCAEGGCGACTVMVSRYDSNMDQILHYSVNACLMPVCAADGCHITTVEGVGQSIIGHGNSTNMHPIQERMTQYHGSQCGFCTPGIIVALYSLFANGVDNNANTVSTNYIEEHLDGNLCRCTGYRPIWDAARSLCDDAGTTKNNEPHGPCGVPCRTCPTRQECDMPCNPVNNSIDLDASITTTTTTTTATAAPPPSDMEDGCGSVTPTSCSTSSSDDEKKDDSEETSSLTINTKKPWNQICTSSQDKCQDSQHPPLSRCQTSNQQTFMNQPNDMFPKELKTSEVSKPLMIVGDTATWFTPTSLKELLRIKYEFPNAKIVVGATEIGIETKFKHMVYPRLIYPSPLVKELQAFDLINDNKTTTLVIGACKSLSSIQHMCDQYTQNEQDLGTIRTCRAIRDMLRWFASTQIRNAACLGGNLATASPISDMNPLLSCMDSQLQLCSHSDDNGNDTTTTTRLVKVSDFFVKYRTVDLKPKEVIVSINIPVCDSYFDYVLPFKQARRREDDISIVTAGIHMKVQPSSDNTHFVITYANLAFGGMAPTTVTCPQTSSYLIGQPWSIQTFDMARRVLMKELYLPSNVPGGQVEYRSTLATSFLFKFFLTTTLHIAQDVQKLTLELQKGTANTTIGGISYKLPLLPEPPTLDDSDMSGTDQFVWRSKPTMVGTQTYPAPKVTVGVEDLHFAKPNTESSLPSLKPSSEKDQLGIPATHASGALHTTGEAKYVDDIPQPSNLLHGALVLSDRCHVLLKNIDKTPALSIPGVVDVYFANDLMDKLHGSNKLGPILKDEEVFATHYIRHVGMVLGIAVADTLEAAQQAARAVQVEYEPIMDNENENIPEEPIISIEDAIKANSFYDMTHHTLQMGNVEADLHKASSDDKNKFVKVSGEFAVGGQEHFYLECNTSLVIPDETGLKVWASTQAVTKTQMFCASATNTPASKVVCHMKRMGGGFGGKETRSVFASAAAAVAAKLTNRPVKLTLDRNVDMAITGQRHAFKAKYTATASFVHENNEGPPLLKLGALDVQIYSNGGCSLDLSLPVLDRCLFHIDNVYKWNSLRAKGVVCKTNQPPHTAFRGFGGPQGLSICETIVDHLISAAAGSASASSNPTINTVTWKDQIRQYNMYHEGDYTPFGMKLEYWNVPRGWKELYSSADIETRRESIEKFNSQNKWKKRGLAILPTKFGIAFTAKFMNQGGALVHLYMDGTVLISHGGTEMGQGLHTKCAQVAAHAFDIPLEQVFIDDTSSDKVANTNPTAASQGTDLYGMATLMACREILQNMQPIREKLGPQATLAEIATAAFFERIDLTAHGYYKLPNDRCGYDWDMPTPSDPQNQPENSWRGHAFNYFTQGVAVSEVEIDVLSGDHRTLRSDVLVDVGSSINPALDIGQIEGAFIQGMGWSTMEECIWGDGQHSWVQPKGRLFTQGPGTYKIPAFNDCPEQFNVSLMNDTPNPFAVHSSRAVGEPPFFLGSTVAFALKDAIRAARAEFLSSSADEHFSMNFPVTSERVRMLCGDIIAREGILLQHVDEVEETKKNEIIRQFQPKGSY